MDKENFSWGGIGFLALFFLLIIGFWNRGGMGFGYGNGYGMPYGDGVGYGYGFQNYKATVDAEKAEIINTARTQYITEQQSSATRELVQSTANTTQAKIDFYAYQDLRDKLAESQRENLILQNKLFVKDELAPVNATLASIQCNMLRRPDVTGVGAVCPNAGIINGLGINHLGGYNSCGCGSL
jgi:hypothetical protein